MSLRDRILAEIETSGPMGFDRYMELGLYDEDEGFFGSGRGAPGANADFVTSPETSDAFGVLIGAWSDGLGIGPGATVVEVGAGSGALLQGLLRAGTADGSVYALERSVPARRMLAERFATVSVGTDLDDVPAGGTALIVGNEILDNMPAALARRTTDGWVELAVGIDAGSLGLVEVPPRASVVAWCAQVFDGAEPGSTVTVQRAAVDWLARLLRRYDRVHACLIDYAGTSDELLRRPFEDLIRAYRRHRPAAGWIDAPGTTDLTVDVNVDAVVAVAVAAGATVSIVDQRSFLLDHGAGELRQELIDEERVAAAEGRIMDQLSARSRRVDLDAVLDPRGFGAFTVFLIDGESQVTGG